MGILLTKKPYSNSRTFRRTRNYFLTRFFLPVIATGVLLGGCSQKNEFPVVTKEKMEELVNNDNQERSVISKKSIDATHVKNHKPETGGLFLTDRDSTVLGITSVTTSRRPVESLDLEVQGITSEELLVTKSPESKKERELKKAKIYIEEKEEKERIMDILKFLAIVVGIALVVVISRWIKNPPKPKQTVGKVERIINIVKRKLFWEYIEIPERYRRKNEVDHMNLEEEFLERFSELKKWIIFKRFPKTIVINSEKERREFSELLEYVLRLGRKFRKKDKTGFMEYVEELKLYAGSGFNEYKKYTQESEQTKIKPRLLKKFEEEVKEAYEKMYLSETYAESVRWFDLYFLIHTELLILYPRYFDTISKKYYRRGDQDGAYRIVNGMRSKETGDGGII